MKNVKAILIPLTMGMALLTGYTNPVIAGSGAGGIITIKNNSTSEIEVTWSGVGCALYWGGISYACNGEYLNSGEEYTYRYNWGVTNTWVNVGIAAHYDVDHPCLDNDTGEGGCLAADKDIDTDAWETDYCLVHDWGLHCTGKTKPYTWNEVPRDNEDYCNLVLIELIRITPEGDPVVVSEQDLLRCGWD